MSSDLDLDEGLPEYDQEHEPWVFGKPFRGLKSRFKRGHQPSRKRPKVIEVKKEDE